MVCCTLEVFEFDLENAIAMSQLNRKPTEERNAATLIFEILKSTESA